MQGSTLDQIRHKFGAVSLCHSNNTEHANRVKTTTRQSTASLNIPSPVGMPLSRGDMGKSVSERINGSQLSADDSVVL